MPELKECTKSSIRTWVSTGQLVVIIFGAGILYNDVNHLKAEVITQGERLVNELDRHEATPWHGNVGIEIATLKAMMSTQLESQRQLVTRIERLVTKIEKIEQRGNVGVHRNGN